MELEGPEAVGDSLEEDDDDVVPPEPVVRHRTPVHASPELIGEHTGMTCDRYAHPLCRMHGAPTVQDAWRGLHGTSLIAGPVCPVSCTVRRFHPRDPG